MEFYCVWATGISTKFLIAKTFQCWYSRTVRTKNMKYVSQLWLCVEDDVIFCSHNLSPPPSTKEIQHTREAISLVP
jgi:hypothetical protein